MSYKTPGVYVEEIVKFPPSVAQVETAIPAFIGYTEIAKKKEDNDLSMIPLRITSMLEYENYFGYADKETGIGVKITDTSVDGVTNRDILVTAPSDPSPYKMYYAMQMYFANGGGPCYIISVGSYTDMVSLGDSNEGLVGGLTELEKLDEPTLIVFPDATSLGGESDFYSLYEAALMQCNKLQDRFTIIDTYTSEEIEADASSIRDGISLGKDYLKYGAAYYPYLNTILDYHYDEDSISITHINESDPQAKTVISTNVSAFDVATEVEAIVDTTSDPSELNGSLAEVINYMYSVNHDVDGKEGLNLDEREGEEGGLTISDKDFDSPRPLMLHDKLTTLLTDLESLIDVKEKINVEANAAIAALEDEVSVDADLNAIKDGLSDFNDLFEEADTIIPVYEELAKLTENLKTFIDEGNDTKIRNVIANNTSNIENEINKLFTITHVASPAEITPIAHDGDLTTIFDDISNDWDTLKAAILDEDFGTDTDAGIAEGINLDTNNGELHGRSLKSIETSYSQMYNQIKAEIGLLPVVLPPSSTMAGVYARIDATRGVWKAPANVGVTYVSEPSVYISHEAQQNLNVDVVAGKSINAIRTFVGKGNLVWGARTLAGNDNEWRYVPVRRFFNMAEESIKKATEQFVFEPNDKNTWVSVKGMISNFLNQQWRAGALAGTTPEQAFYVSIGLGETMTAQDILEGSMIVEIGMAVVRPAEFIVLKFSHKMQEV